MSKYYMNSNKTVVTNKKTVVTKAITKEDKDKEFYFPPLPTNANKKNTTTTTTTFGTTSSNYLLKAKAIPTGPIISNSKETVKWSKDDFYVDEPEKPATVKWSEADFCDDEEEEDYYEDDYEEEDRQFRNQFEDRCDPIEWD